MNKYTNIITLDKNSRGVYGLDTLKGCSGGLNAKYTEYPCSMFNLTYETKRDKGCYGLCYACKIAKFRGYDFRKVEKRYFKDDKHLALIGKKLSKLEFIRIGVSCDPSDDWEHTLDIVDKIRPYIKNIVIITKHWNRLTYKQCLRLKGLCVNTSISALDTQLERDNRLFWYNKLKEFCTSVLRVNTAKYNCSLLNELQDKLLSNKNIIDNVLRFTKGHELIKNGIVKVQEVEFLNGKALASKNSERVFFGYCKDCDVKCGISYMAYSKE